MKAHLSALCKHSVVFTGIELNLYKRLGEVHHGTYFNAHCPLLLGTLYTKYSLTRTHI